MASYIMDVFYGKRHFLDMNWAWKKGCPPVHMYYLVLWDTNYKYNFEKNCNSFMAPLLSTLTCERTPCMSECARQVVSKVSDWHAYSCGVYLHIYGATKPPHLFPHYLLDKLVLLKITYHTYVTRLREAMIRKKKTSWLNLPLEVGAYKTESVKQVETEIEIFKVYQFGEKTFRWNNPRNILK